MRKIFFLFTFLAMLGMQVMAQRQITGTVTNADDGSTIPGVSVFAKGTTAGTVTDLNGKFTLTVPAEAKVLTFSFVGMVTQEVAIGSESVINVNLKTASTALEGVVVTALGVTREKKSLGYATQQIDGDDVRQLKGSNFVNTLSGRVAGIQIKNSGNMGGSTNVVIRGSKSLTGNNQALFVVDGIPINNDNTNNAGQISGRNGYDYGTAVSDINPNDIESMNILKGAAATALYGSRAANGVVLITTKKGKQAGDKRKALGITISSNVTGGFYDKSTFPTYQKDYGAGYGSTWYSESDNPGMEYIYDINGDGQPDYTVPTYEDASMGQKFDPNLLVYQWDAFYPESPNYKKATPWVAGANGPEYLLRNTLSLSNSVEIAGGGQNSTFRLSYSNLHQTGLLPNSSLDRNNFAFTGTYDILKDVTVTASANYINNKGKGRNSTGYSDNLMSSFRQWMQVNVDYKQQEEMYNLTGKNITWNPVSPYDLAPAYWDNPYYQRNESYETDERNRIIGYVQADWKLNNYFSLMSRISVDTYNELQEERRAVGSASGEFGVNRVEATAGYSRFDKFFMETNFDFMAKYNQHITEDFNINAVLGTNIRRTRVDQVYASTNGGLIVPGLYALSNSASDMLAPQEIYNQTGVNGIFASASFGFKNTYYLDATIRRDQSSTLPVDNNSYFYPAVSASVLFSELLPDQTWMQLGKFRLGYAEVGNMAPWGSTIDTYTFNGIFSGTALYSVPNIKNNSSLKPERTKSLEAGLELNVLDNRLRFDVAVYKTNTVDQIIPVAVSTAAGYSSKYVNAGEVENKGIEIQVAGTPLKLNDFSWDVILNWSKNTNKVVSLADGLENLQLAALQGGVTINARVGEPYGTIQGQDFVYLNGKKVVGSNGYYVKSSTSDKILGNINPDCVGGLSNKFAYKNWALSFLIDWQKGGSVFSLDMYYGLATGLYPETNGVNELGNPVRNPITDDNTTGGIILDGVYADGSINTTRVPGDDYRVFGYSKNPNAAFVYDASYVKLREVMITYSLPAKVLAKTFIKGASFSLVGSNLWIIHKNLPYADPEATQSSGNIQGWQSGVMPTTRNIGFTVNLSF